VKKIFPILLCCLVICISACSDDNSNNDNNNQTSGFETANLTVKTINALTGNVITGVNLTSSGKQSTTNQLGVSIFENLTVNNNQLNITAKINGYAPAFSNVKVNTLNSFTEIALIPVQSESFSSSSQQFINFDNSNTQIVFPANAFVTENGTDYNGIVNIELAYIEPNQPNFGRTMPGNDFMAINSDGQEQFLVSYGAISAELTGQNGEILQLTEGKQATLKMPVPENTSEIPNQIPMWYFDEEQSIWIEEGVATLNGEEYIAQVSHFSWWNCDVPQTPNTYIEGYVVDCNNYLVVGTTVQAGPVSSTTNNEGFFSINVAANVNFNVSVNSPGYDIIYVESVIGGQTLELGIIEPLTICPPNVVNISTIDCFGKFISASYYCSGCLNSNSGTLTEGINQIQVASNTNVTIMITANGETEFVEFYVSDEDIDSGSIVICDDNNDDDTTDDTLDDTTTDGTTDTTDDGTLDDATTDGTTDTTDDGTLDDTTDDGTLDDATTDGTTDSTDGGSEITGSYNIDYSSCSYFTIESNDDVNSGYQFTNYPEQVLNFQDGLSSAFIGHFTSAGDARIALVTNDNLQEQSIGHTYFVDDENFNGNANAAIGLFIDNDFFLMKFGTFEILSNDGEFIEIQYQGQGFDCTTINCSGPPIGNDENITTLTFLLSLFQPSNNQPPVFINFSTYNSLTVATGTVCIPIQ